jgi:hypothetical protein
LDGVTKSKEELMSQDHGEAAFALAQSTLLLLVAKKMVTVEQLRPVVALAESRMHAEGKRGAAGLIAGLRAALDDIEQDNDDDT